MSDNTNLKWYFPKAENVSGRGENDPQRELFPGDIYQTMVRESIQNSLDHPNPDNDSPVRVEYKIRKFATSDFPYLKDDLRKHIESCYTISRADKFRRMLDVLSASHFYMLEVADYNTIGMDYDYDTDSGRFKKFVRYTGDPNEVVGAGGSHGYGKITYFSVSEINTVVVSSVATDDKFTFEGVSRLATHPTGIIRESYYDTGFLDSRNGTPIKCEKTEASSFVPECFQRKEIGTTVYIPFINIDDSNKGKVYKKCCEAVLRNFFAAIDDGKLEVLIDFSEGELFGDGYIFECRRDNIEDVFSNQFFNNPPYDNVKTSFFDKFNPQPYWRAYRNNDVTITDGDSYEEAVERCVGAKYISFRKKLPILGNTSLFVNVDLQRGNDLILFMRSPRMVVGVQHNSSSQGYSAVFLCDDEEKGNQLLRIMEDAAHRTWSKRQLKLDKRPQEKIEQAGLIEEEMREFIHWCLNVVFPATQTDSDDVELEDFTVPLISENDTTNPLIGSLINLQGKNDDVLGAPVDIHADQLIPSKKSTFIGKAQIIEPKKVQKTETEAEPSGGRKYDHPTTPSPDPTPKPYGEDHYEEDEEKEERTVRMKFPVKYRVFSEEVNDGQFVYTLIIHSPQQEEKAYLTLIPVGETDDKSCNVHIQSASKGKIRENELSEVPLLEGKNVISFTVDNSGEYAFSLLAEHDVTFKE